MSKYLVTGGAGFIGTNTIKYLMAEGHEVVSFDNYAGGRNEERVVVGARYVEGDVRDSEALNKLCSEGFDGIVHLAALPRVTYSVEQPWLTHDTNVNGTLKVLIAARDNKIKRVVFASSSSVYGNTDVFPTNEKVVPNPISPYSLHKFIGENYCRLFNSLFGLETVCLRYFNVYGPYFDPEGPYALVIGKFLKQVKNGEPMTVCGDGEYLRDIVHVSDVARANVLALTKDNVGKGEIINIGTGVSHTVNDLVKMVGGPSVFVPERPGDVRKTHADVSKAKELLGWEPTIKLEDGINELKKEWGIE
ncbi:MAG: NAD-dependent epimerase/dehydratase family protein [Candidatus Magasanikbacteria bacterium]|nr:NAD-dependent epimerase/dehydratase family protein [Candidatus Magasanikbacteria bacterium]